MELFSKTTEEGWRLFYTSEDAMNEDVENNEFVAQHKDNKVMSFWANICVDLHPGANVEKVVATMIQFENAIDEELS